MSLRPPSDLAVPDETTRVDRAAFSEPSHYMRMRDALGPLFRDDDFADLFGVLVALEQVWAL